MKTTKKIIYSLSFCFIIAVTFLQGSNHASQRQDQNPLSENLNSLPFSEAIGEGSGAKYCRCKEYDCNAANYISVRPICQQGGGDCSLSDANC